MLEHDNLNNAVSGNLAARHRSGSYLCRYRSCPRAIQGFTSLHLRQEHENSHAPRFRCNDAACGDFATGLTSRAAMNRHNKKYHCDDHLKAIPTSLRKTYTPKQEKSRFSLGEPPSTRRESPLHAAEEDKLVSEVDAALDPADNVQDLKPSTTKCICGFADEGIGDLINCDACDTAQHFQCYYVNDDGNFSEFDEHFCIDCKPRPIDAKMATIRQKDRKNEHLEYLHAVELARDKVKKNDYGPGWLKPWSVVEKEIMRPLMRHHGTNWKRIADDIGTSTYAEVCNSVFGIE